MIGVNSVASTNDAFDGEFIEIVQQLVDIDFIRNSQEITSMTLKNTFLILVGLASASASGFAQPRIENAPSVQDRPLPAPMTHLEPKTENGITYLCGGVGEDEANAMKQAALDYDLMVTFAATNGAYLAGVNVDIADARGRSLLKTSCDAPIMLVGFETPGNYRIRGSANGHVITSRAQVRAGGRVKTLAMAWPVSVIDMAVAPDQPAGQSSGGSGDAGMSGGGVSTERTAPR